MNTGHLHADKPTAVCLVRPDISGLETPRHAALAQRHTEQLGYLWLYTVRPPADHPDPIGFGLGIAAGLAANTVVVYDLTTVDNTPSRVCEMFDLETVCPPTTWAAALPAQIDPDHTHPDAPLTTIESFRIMQQHMTCRALECPRKASAYGHLVRAGKIVPPVDTPRERAAERGIAFQPCDPHPQPGPDIQTLLDVLDGLTHPYTDSRALAARLSPGAES